ncbi:APC family permease [Siminovitchia sediminis]|uniref:APC family permease n=1 Tax=Siminovitchia sediminis TaxID=1274353 RepID=A0ABW4KEV2_9BACI
MDNIQSTESNRLYKGSLSYFHIVLMVLASAAPMVVVPGYIPLSISFGAGLATPLVYALATIILLVFSVGYVEMAKRITAAGAFYTFVTQGLGKSLGLSAGFASLFCYALIEAAILGGLGFFATELFANHFGLQLPWYAYSFCGLFIIFAISYFRVTLTAKILGLALMIELLLILIVDFAILGNGGAEGIQFYAFNPMELAAAPALGVGFFLAFWSWIGFEGTAIYGEETVDPKKSVPKATYTAVILLGVFYTFSAFMSILGFGKEAHLIATQDTSSYFFVLAESYAGPVFRTFMDYFAVTAFFACAFAFHNNASRYFYVFGREGILPKALGKTHPVYQSPYIASTAQLFIAFFIVGAFALAGSEPLLGLGTWMAIIATLAILTVQFCVSLAVIGYFNRIGRKSPGDYLRTIVAPGIGAITQAIVIVLLIQNITFLAESDSIVVKLIPFYVLTVYVLAYIYSIWLKKNKLETYNRIGQFE